jgi:hypothetical protein
MLNYFHILLCGGVVGVTSRFKSTDMAAGLPPGLNEMTRPMDRRLLSMGFLMSLGIIE